MKESIISIIVPMYNSEKSIRMCIDSLLNQTCEDVEIIIVNDGSTDSSLSIVKDYQIKFPNIKVISKDNGGVSSARNLGLKNAKGKYITFVDSDDWCEKEMYEDMIKLAEEGNYDIIFGGYCMDNHMGKNILKIKSDRTILPKNKREIGEILHSSNVSYCVGKLFRREIIANNEIYFNEELSMGEDAIFTCDYLCKIDRMAIINKTYYHYIRLNNESLSTKYVDNIDSFINMIWDRLDILYEKYPYFKELEHLDGSSREINSSKMHLYNNYRKGCTLNSSERRKQIKKYMDNRTINTQMKMHYPNSKKDKLYYFLFKLKSPLIMDFIYSLRIFINNISEIFTGVKK